MRGTWKRLIRPIILVAVSLLAGRIVIGLVGSVDWGQVWSALGRLSWSAVPVLILLLLVRQAFNAVPLATFAALVVAYVEVAGEAFEPEIIAGFVVWRVVTIGGPLLLGLAALLAWRWRMRHAEAAA